MLDLLTNYIAGRKKTRGEILDLLPSVIHMFFCPKNFIENNILSIISLRNTCPPRLLLFPFIMDLLERIGKPDHRGCPELTFGYFVPVQYSCWLCISRCQAEE